MRRQQCLEGGLVGMIGSEFQRMLLPCEKVFFCSDLVEEELLSGTCFDGGVRFP